MTDLEKAQATAVKLGRLGIRKEYYCSNCECSECVRKKRIIESI